MTDYTQGILTGLGIAGRLYHGRDRGEDARASAVARRADEDKMRHSPTSIVGAATAHTMLERDALAPDIMDSLKSFAGILLGCEWNRRMLIGLGMEATR